MCYFFSLKTYSHFTCMQWYIQQLEYKRNCCVGAAHVHVDALKIFWFRTLLNVRGVWMRCYLWLFRSVEHLASLVRWSRQTINARVQHVLWDDVHCRVSSASPWTTKLNRKPWDVDPSSTNLKLLKTFKRTSTSA